MMEPKRILITGASGLLGSNLALYYREHHTVWGTFHRHPVHIDGVNMAACDLTDVEQVRRLLADSRPDVVIHCAAMTDVDACETDTNDAYAANVVATRNLVTVSSGLAVKLLYISTDSVYKGEKEEYSETDPVDPVNYYGKTKYQGELESLKKEGALILRTNFFGWGGGGKTSLAEWIVNTLKSESEIKGFTDVFFSPLYISSLANVINLCLQKDLSGIYNCGSMDSCSKYEFAKKVADRFGLNYSRVVPVSIDDLALSAIRGKCLSMRSEKLQNDTGLKLPTISDSINKFYQDRLPNNFLLTTE